MGVGLVPINQQNALPLYSTLAGASGGQLQLIGTNITRFWSTVAVGGLTSAGAPGLWIAREAQFNLESDTFDWRGCSRFSLTMTITNNTGVGLGAGAAWGIYVTQGTTGGVFPLVQNDKANLLQASGITITPALGNGASVMRNAVWLAGGTGGGVGAYWRVVINTTLAANSINGVDFSTELWGAQ